MLRETPVTASSVVPSSGVRVSLCPDTQAVWCNILSNQLKAVEADCTDSDAPCVEWDAMCGE